MTRKDFELIARAMRSTRYADMTAIRTAIADDAARAMANALATTNALFDRERFLKACGVESCEG